MKFRLLMLFAAGTLLHCGQANADVFIVGVNGSASAGGTTQDISISGTNIRPGGSSEQIPQRWDATQPLGITGGVFEGTFGGTDTASNDWYVLIGDTGGVRQLNAAVGGSDGFNFLEIFYSIDSDVTLNGSGTGHRFAVNGNSPAESFPASQQGLIPTTAGAHSFVIDIAQLTQAGDEIDSIRWDPWNVTDDLNRGTAFTIDRVTFGTELVAIPEPTVSVLMVLGLGMFTLRRQK